MGWVPGTNDKKHRLQRGCDARFGGCQVWEAHACLLQGGQAVPHAVGSGSTGLWLKMQVVTVKPSHF